jgi:DNA sulfur modification protein DndD
VEGKLNRAREEDARVQLGNDATDRLLRHSARARGTVERFKTELSRRHMWRLEGLILESLDVLMRKKGFLRKVTIHPESCNLTVMDQAGRSIAAGELSAGERQLLAVAILWALAKASEKRLPAVIDTPLGRLDGVHRTLLVQNYFPKASHQVLLLSTDQEVDEHYYRLLRHAVAREYRIEFSHEANGSSFRDGYFWHNEEAIAA